MPVLAGYPEIDTAVTLAGGRRNGQLKGAEITN
jgi:hypothetical protein